MNNRFKSLILLLCLSMLVIFPNPGLAEEKGKLMVKSMYLSVLDADLLNEPKKHRPVLPSETISLRSGGYNILYAHAVYSDNSVGEISPEWKSDNPMVVTVSNGWIIGNREGKAVVTASFGGYTASVEVSVSPAVSLVLSIDEGRSSGNVKVVSGKIIMEKGSRAGTVLTPILADGTKNGTRGDKENLTYNAEWETRNEEIAVVGRGNSGIDSVPSIDIIACGEGTTEVSAKLDGVTIVIEVDVVPDVEKTPMEPADENKVTSLAITLDREHTDENVILQNEILMNNANSVSMILTATFADGTQQKATYFADWKTGNPNIAIIGAGGNPPKRKIIPMGVGSTVVTASYGGVTTSVKVGITEVTVMINGVVQVYDQPPVILNDRTLVPLRGIFEALGANVSWDQNTKTVTATREGITIRLTIGSNKAYKNGEAIILDQPPKLINDRTLMPIRFVSEAIEAKVDWDQRIRTVVITK